MPQLASLLARALRPEGSRYRSRMALRQRAPTQRRAREAGPPLGLEHTPYLTCKPREYDLATEFIELAGKVNAQMPEYCVTRIERALNDAGKPVNGTKILLLGMSYKAGVGDVRESPAITIATQLQALHADLSYHDPYVPQVPELGLRSVELRPALAHAEAVVILTAHPDIDHVAVAAAAPLVLDFRGVLHRAAVHAAQRG